MRSLAILDAGGQTFDVLTNVSENALRAPDLLDDQALQQRCINRVNPDKTSSYRWRSTSVSRTSM
jgi:hypothetical protein